MSDGLIKISYPVEADSWDGASGENIWVQLVELVDMDPPHRTIATVESIPFSTRTLSYGDKILLKYEERENRVVFGSIVERGGHSTCQIYVEKENPDASAMLKQMKLIGCGWEGGQHGALDIPPGVDFDEPLASSKRDRMKVIGFFRRDTSDIPRRMSRLRRVREQWVTAARSTIA